jgi:hypothetical protein
MTEQGYGNADPFAHQIPASDEYAHINTGEPVVLDYTNACKALTLCLLC